MQLPQLPQLLRLVLPQASFLCLPLCRPKQQLPPPAARPELQLSQLLLEPAQLREPELEQQLFLERQQLLLKLLPPLLPV